MSHPLYVAFVWHQHQPLYRSQVSLPPWGGDGTLAGSGATAPPVLQKCAYRLPWVRLHGVKDYLDLILLLKNYPKLHQTVNLVPSLILQLEDYIAGTAIDPYLAVALLPSEQLRPEHHQFILAHGFDAHVHTMIEPHPRYAELYQQRQDKGMAWCLDNWESQEYGDLLTWHNLAWFDPLYWDDPEIAQWLERGRNFTLGDRQRLFSKQREILSRIVPEHREMQASGQLEVMTSPYTHPILPLLADTNVGRVAVPTMELPQHRFQWAEDIPRHLQKAWNLYQDRFGCSPRGLWPSEQAISPAVLPYITQQGFEWICSDEAILGWTVDHFFHRDGLGTVCEPELLYRPYRLETEHGDLSIVFRDHRLSDLIGFTYGSMEPKRAAADLVGHLEAIARMLKHRQLGGGTSLEQPWLVTIALDGENCWEFYQQDGKPFLEALYHFLSDTSDLQLVTVSEFLAQFPATEILRAQQLHTGSWVDGSLTTWIGDPAKNRAWEYLTAARQTLANHPEATETANPAAWEALYAAEGSDWFWWFGEGHSSNQDAIFDQLFREHLCVLYQSLQEPIPDYLRYAVEAHESRADHKPQGFIHPLIQGHPNDQDWNKAGRIEIGGARGTMHRSSPMQRLWYGVDHLNFYLRLDFQVGTEAGKDFPPELHLLWFYPDRPMHNSPIPLNNIPNSPPLNYLYHHHLGVNLLTQTVWFQEAGEHHQWHDHFSRALVGLDHCLEIAVPWADLRAEPDWCLRLLLVQSEAGEFQDYFPDSTLVPIDVP
ncbi:glycoside hydrolase [Neosynechococcus sphagnicola sy1]|uniref:Glycoside hydrolase n=1 Tax=Neosynechococcus sphagnicola sy1 TaxID=1497020 RepID=A0A098TKF9_9CYAN|nr:glycoside hydrolase [Neosynechococcus sphagnicola]KGF72774.1 glycoside hydrolase [Neosynechococcus sphagnicola sy1]